MRPPLLRALAAFGALALVLGPAAAARADYPAPEGYVVDTAGAVPAGVEATMEAELLAYDRRTTNQVAVAVVQSLDGQTVEDYALALFNSWGVGTAEKNNGVLLLLAIDDHADRIQVGLGLEGVLTEATAKRILDTVVSPAAKRGDFGSAVVLGERAIRAAMPATGPAPTPVGDVATDAPFGGGQADDGFTDAPAPDPGGALVPGPDNAVPSSPGGSGGPSGGAFVGFFVVIAVLGAVGRVLGGGGRYGYGPGYRRGYGSSLGAGLLFGSALNSARRNSGSGSAGGTGGGGNWGAGLGGGGGNWGGGGGGGSWGGGGGGGFGGGSSGGGGASGGW